MAIVRFSAELKHIIMNNAKRAFNNNIDELRSHINESEFHYAYLKEYESELRTLKLVPKQYRVNTVMKVDLQIVDLITDADYNVQEVAVRIRNFPLLERLHIPNIDDTPLVRIDLFNKESPLTIAMIGVLQPFYDESVSIDKKLATIQSLTENFGSLNKALEHWGLLEQFVPAQYMNKVREVVERKTRKKSNKPSIDKNVLDDMTVSIMTSKLLDE